MAENLNSIGSIAVHILESFNNVPAGVSGNMIEIVDMARQHVANYVNETIGSNSISAEYQPPIVSYAKADVIDFVNAQAGGESIKLAELSISETGEEMSAKQWRMLAEGQLKAIGRGIKFAKSLS
jgi:hypothetical protein